MGGIEHTVYTVVGERIGVAGAVRSPVHAADVTVVMAAITQGLRELAAADARQPTADVIAICQCVCAAAVQSLGRHAALVVVGVACQGHCGIVVQLMRNSTDTVGIIIFVGDVALVALDKKSLPFLLRQGFFYINSIAFKSCNHQNQ